jgi:hypothetical protein
MGSVAETVFKVASELESLALEASLSARVCIYASDSSYV